MDFVQLMVEAITNSLPCSECGKFGEKIAKCHYCRSGFCGVSCAYKHVHTCSEKEKKINSKTITLVKIQIKIGQKNCSQSDLRYTYNFHTCESKLHSFGKPSTAIHYCKNCKMYLCSGCGRCSNHSDKY